MRKSVTRSLGHSPDSGEVLRYPAAATLAPVVTRCTYCGLRPIVLRAVSEGVERFIDPAALSLEGLATAAGLGRWVGVVRPWGPVLIQAARPDHWWVAQAPPTLLAAHVHKVRPPLATDPSLTAALLQRLLAGAPPPPPRTPGDEPPF